MGMGETQTAALAVQCGRCNSKVTSGVGGTAHRGCRPWWEGFWEGVEEERTQAGPEE